MRNRPPYTPNVYPGASQSSNAPRVHPLKRAAELGFRVVERTATPAPIAAREAGALAWRLRNLGRAGLAEVRALLDRLGA